MARKEIYSKDLNVTLDDKVIGTDAVDNSTKNFTVGDMLALASGGAALTAGAGITINNGVISSTVVDTDTNNFVSNVVLNGTDLDFTGTGGAFQSSVSLSTIADQTVTLTGASGITVAGTYPNFTISSSVADTNDIDYIDQVILNGNILDFTGMGNAFTGGVDLSPFKNIYTAGTNIDITNNVISCTVTDTNTTYSYGAAGAGGNILFALSGSDSTNNVVTMAAGQNITLTDNGNNNFTVAATGGVTTLVGLSDTAISSPSNLDTLTYNGSAWVNTPAVTSSGPERLVMKIATTQATLSESDLLIESAGTSVANNTVHYNASDLSPNLPSFEIANDCTMRIALSSYLGSGGQQGHVIFRIYETFSGSAILMGEAAFILSNATSSLQAKTFFSYFEAKAGETYKFTVEAQQHIATIGPGSYIEVEIID